MLLKQSAIREIAKDRGVRLGGEFLDALDLKVNEILSSAIQRAENARRQTVKPEDV